MVERESYIQAVLKHGGGKLTRRWSQQKKDLLRNVFFWVVSWGINNHYWWGW